MSTEVLHPQDVLSQLNRFRRNSNRKVFNRPAKKKNEFAAVMRRGEPDESKRGGKEKSGGLVVSKQIRARVGELRSKEEVYAGSGIPSSPSPAQLPLPTFTMRKVKSFDDFATRDLRRLLRLD